MNTSRLYKLLTENEDAFKKNGNYVTYQVYDEILGMVNEELAREAEKAAGRKPNIRNAVKKFVGTEKWRPALAKASIQEIDGKTYYGYCDGFKLAWSPVDFNLGVNENGQGMNWKNILEGYGNKARTAVTINKADVIQFIKEHKGERRSAYTIRTESGHEVDFNPEYLKNCMDFTETTTIYIEEGHNCAPAFFHNEEEDRHALVLPIRR